MKPNVLFGLIVVAGAAAGGALWFHHHHGSVTPEPLAAVATPPAPSPDAPLPKVQDSDAKLRSLLDGVTPEGRFHDWLSADDLLRRWVGATDQIARDVSPRGELPFLRPDRPFKTVRKADGLEMSPRNYTRFDAVGNVAGSIDGRKLATVYRALHPLLESAYRQLGYAGQSIDGVTARALQRLSDAPVANRPPLLQPSKGLYVFADAALESRGPVEKALLRMGPRNTHLVQQAAREIAAALGMPLQAQAMQ
jgi:hypothetical protein